MIQLFPVCEGLPSCGVEVMCDQLTDAQITELKEAFDAFDTVGEGTIATADLGNVMRCLGQHPTDGEVKDVCSRHDGDGDGSRINFATFLHVMAPTQRFRESNCEFVDAFAVHDRDGNGFISAADVRFVVLNVGLTPWVTNGDVEDMIRVCDVHGDGKVDFKMFARMFLSK